VTYGRLMEIDIVLWALLITAGATVVYATLTYLLLLETRREKKKPIIEEILGIILFPLRQLLFDESSDFKKGNARLLCVRGKIRSDYKINRIYSWEPDFLVFKDFRKNNPEIAEMIDKHDALLSELEEAANSIGEVLYTTDFKKKCDELVIMWEEVGHQKITNAIGGNQLYDDILTYLINNIENLDEKHLFYEFWEVNHEIFFKEKERLAKKQSKNLENKLEQFEMFTNKFSIKIERLIDSYQKKYNIAPKFIIEKYRLYQRGFL
jgi:hypothetical protein